jgi:hypothetical protein
MTRNWSVSSTTALSPHGTLPRGHLPMHVSGLAPSLQSVLLLLSLEIISINTTWIGPTYARVASG